MTAAQRANLRRGPTAGERRSANSMIGDPRLKMKGGKKGGGKKSMKKGGAGGGGH